MPHLLFLIRSSTSNKNNNTQYTMSEHVKVVDIMLGNILKLGIRNIEQIIKKSSKIHIRDLRSFLYFSKPAKSNSIRLM